MFELVSKHKKWIMIGLFVLIIPPFALFGIDSYFRDTARTQSLATVGDSEISEQEFTNALRERQEQLRNMTGGRVDPALLDTPEQRFAVLENLIRQRVLLLHAARSGLTVTPEQLRTYIAQAPELQENGQFSRERYQQFLRERGLTATAFENDLRRNLLLIQLSEAFVETSFAPRTVAERVLRIAEQQREVSRAVISPERFVGQVKLEEGAAKKYYAENQDEFRVPEQARVEYVTLSGDALADTIQIDGGEVKQYYEQNQRQFGVGESRQASHILIAADPSAGPEAKQKARALAEQLQAELKKDPSRFAELAKKHSQDPGSAAKGGDLGTFSRGVMVKAFDDAVFSLKVGEISAPVETEFGYHIIRVTGVSPAKVRSFEQARPEIEKELRKQRAARAYAEVAEKLNNIAFEQSESLKPAAELLKQAPQTSGWITRNRAEEPRLNNPKLLQAIFSEDVLVNKRNSEAVEVAPGTIVVARVIEHKPSALRPFEEVKGAIEKKLVEMRASQLAAQEGRQLLEQLRQGKDVPLQWSAPQLVSRADQQGLNEALLKQVFKADASKLPAFSGIEAPGGGFALLRISKVVEPPSVDRAQQKSLGEGLAQVLGQEQFAAYLASLTGKTKVSIYKEQLEKRP